MKKLHLSRRSFIGGLGAATVLAASGLSRPGLSAAARARLAFRPFNTNRRPLKSFSHKPFCSA